VRHDIVVFSVNEISTKPLDNSGAPEGRFRFGENWRSFLAQLDDARIAAAERSLQELLGRVRLDDQRFLDIGSGSGLSSLVARRLGASVYSFDYDNQSVECTKALRARFFFADDPKWQVEQGSILDRDYLARLGRFDIVYSWGVLHHTGAMLEAIVNASKIVAPGGIFVFALYRKTRLCWLWSLEKRWYCRASPRAQAVACKVYVALMRLAFVLAGRNFGDHVSNYRSCRGMDYVHDIRDWLGGYPYESISPAQVAQVMGLLGFAHLRSKVQPYSTGLFGSGCDEYVYARH
jgi:2-polyprenyl-6-hydroxyphenyl methylase/3-demethylubiquinone-9 3-methyltransferase